MMQFDSADLASLEAQGQLVNVILHEMGHVLGLGTIWTGQGPDHRRGRAPTRGTPAPSAPPNSTAIFGAERHLDPGGEHRRRGHRATATGARASSTTS